MEVMGMAGSAAADGPQAVAGDLLGRELEAFRSRLQSLRIRQREVAEWAGITGAALSRQLRGDVPPDPAILVAAGELMIQAARSRMRSDRRLRAGIAYHEAGHAVVGRVLGVPVRQVSIAPRYLSKPRRDRVVFPGVAFGHVAFHRRGARDTWHLWRSQPEGPTSDRDIPPLGMAQWALDDATVCLAGPTAEASRYRLREWLAQRDVGRAYALFLALWPDGRERPEEELGRLWGDWFDGVARRTVDLVVAHWPAIENVAQALLERETFTGRQFARIVEPHFARLRAA